MRVPAHAYMCVEGSKHIGTIHQLSTCNHRFGGLMTVCFNDHRLPESQMGYYRTRGRVEVV